MKYSLSAYKFLYMSVSKIFKIPLRPKYNVWVKAPELVYNFDEMEDNREFVSATFQIKIECFITQ